MNEHNSTDSIQQAVLDKVRAGTVRRRPRYQFMLRVAAASIVAALLLVTSACLVSFVLFSLHESGEQFLLGFGVRGIEVFFLLFPWLPAVVVVALLVILEWLLRGFKIGYRIPLLTIFLGIVGVSTILGILINFTPLHPTLLNYADKKQLPVIGGSYEHIFDPHEDKGVCQGTVISVTQNSFTIQYNDQDNDHDDGTFVIHIPHGSNLRLPRVGDYVLVFGDPEPGGSVTAENIQIVPPPHP
jgi:hypothetical protein